MRKPRRDSGARMARRIVATPAAERSGGGVGEQDGSHGLGAGGARAGVPTGVEEHSAKWLRRASAGGL